MADQIGTAATGGTNSDGSRWVQYDAGDWVAVAQNNTDSSSWAVFLIPTTKIGGHRAIRYDDARPIMYPVWMSEQTACLVAEAVAIAVGHVLGATVPAEDPAEAEREEGSNGDR